MFVCLYGVFRPTREFFNSYGDVTIAGEGLQTLTYERHSWPLNSEGSSKANALTDMRHSHGQIHILLLRSRSYMGTPPY